MQVKSLYLKQFRYFTEEYFEFNASLNLIAGPNAHAKTSILEALYYLMIGRSFRPSQHEDLIKIGTPSFYLEAVFNKHGVDQKLRLFADSKERKIVYNSTPLPSISNLLGVIQGVVMTPDDVNLVKGPPLIRRQFIDVHMAQTDPLYVHYLTRYARAMRQRNILLKQKTAATIESWEHEMAQAAAYIITKRRNHIEALKTACQTFYAFLTEEAEQLTLEYQSGASGIGEEIKDHFIRQYKKNRDREMLLGYTLSGPHKDDLWIGIGGKDVRYFASEGQQRSCVAALHVGVWQLLKEQSGLNPLFMIDDVGISLDEKRRRRLLTQLISMGQVFLTSTDTDLIHTLPCAKTCISLPLAEPFAK